MTQVEHPPYWQQLKEYGGEAEHEDAVPETFGEWVKDFAVWLEETIDEVHRVKVLTPDENDLLGNALYSLLELNEDVVDDDKDSEGYAEEVEYNKTLRELVEREWQPFEPEDNEVANP